MSTENNYDNNYIIDIHGIQAIKISQLPDINDNIDSNQTHVYSYQYMWDINNSFNYGKYGAYCYNYGAYSYDLNDYDEDVSYQQDYQSYYLLLATETNNYKLEYSTVKDDLGIPEINASIIDITSSIDCLSYDIDNKVDFLNTYHNKFNVNIKSEDSNLDKNDIAYYINLSYTYHKWSTDKTDYMRHPIDSAMAYTYELSIGLTSNSANKFNSDEDLYNTYSYYIYLYNEDIENININNNNYYNNDKIKLVNKGLITDREFNSLIFNVNDLSYYTNIRLYDQKNLNNTVTNVFNNTINNPSFISSDTTYISISNKQHELTYSYHYFSYNHPDNKLWIKKDNNNIGYKNYKIEVTFSRKTGDYIAYADTSNNSTISNGLVDHVLLKELVSDINSSNSYFNNRLTWCRLDKNNN